MTQQEGKSDGASEVSEEVYSPCPKPPSKIVQNDEIIIGNDYNTFVIRNAKI